MVALNISASLLLFSPIVTVSSVASHTISAAPISSKPDLHEKEHFEPTDIVFEIGIYKLRLLSFAVELLKCYVLVRYTLLSSRSSRKLLLKIRRIEACSLVDKLENQQTNHLYSNRPNLILSWVPTSVYVPYSSQRVRTPSHKKSDRLNHLDCHWSMTRTLMSDRDLYL